MVAAARAETALGLAWDGLEIAQLITKRDELCETVVVRETEVTRLMEEGKTAVTERDVVQKTAGALRADVNQLTVEGEVVRNERMWHRKWRKWRKLKSRG